MEYKNRAKNPLPLSYFKGIMLIHKSMRCAPWKSHRIYRYQFWAAAPLTCALTSNKSAILKSPSFVLILQPHDPTACDIIFITFHLVLEFQDSRSELTDVYSRNLTIFALQLIEKGAEIALQARDDFWNKLSQDQKEKRSVYHQVDEGIIIYNVLIIFGSTPYILNIKFIGT